VKVTYTVTPWGSRYRVQIKVDGYDTERAFFDSYQMGERWAKAKTKELEVALEEVRK
jgi:hypothetical protein